MRRHTGRYHSPADAPVPRAVRSSRARPPAAAAASACSSPQLTARLSLLIEGTMTLRKRLPLDPPVGCGTTCAEAGPPVREKLLFSWPEFAL